MRRSALTDTAGEYRFAGLPTGNYSLRLEKTGFQSQVREGVELNSAVEVTINWQLAIGDISQQTTVSANAAGIDSTTSTLDGVMWFAKSQRCRVHFKNQRALIVPGKGKALEIKAFTLRRRAEPLRGTPAKPSI